jgi:hypothetical protein
VNHSAIQAEVNAVTWELGRTAALVRIAEIGLRKSADEVLKKLKPEHEHQDLWIHVGEQDPRQAPPTGSIRASELVELAAKNGAGGAMLEQQWIVTIFSRWEHYYRPRIAKLGEAEPDQVMCPLFGDLRLRRHDVVHNNAIASTRHSGRTSVLPAIDPGQPVRMTDGDFVLARKNVKVWIEPTG